MVLKFFNTLSGRKENFVPLEKDRVGMYNCGPTVYQRAHIGNLRAYVFADILRRTLEQNNYTIRQVINITDVGHLVGDGDEGEDKVEVGARREGRSAAQIAEFYTQTFLEDLKKLNVKTDGTLFPRATAHIPEQIELIKILEEKGFTYRISDGLYFDTAKFPNYGKLGQIDLAGEMAGARVPARAGKKNPRDFALWKFSSNLETLPPNGGKASRRQQEWASPWGVGFPGWHLECSAMSVKYLGQPFDIHTGGVDHIGTHHNNEIAQSEAATCKPLANFWLHSEFLNLAGEKIAKSVGNTLSLDDLIKKNISPLAYRYWLLMAHYRTPINFNLETLLGTEKALERLQEVFLKLPIKNGKVNENYQTKLIETMGDDLNTPRAIANLQKLFHDETLAPADKYATILEYDKILGLNFIGIQPAKASTEIKKLMKERETARLKGDFKQSDILRVKIQELGYLIEDTSTGPHLRKINKK